MLDLAVTWTFVKETYVPEDAIKLLRPKEKVVAVFKTLKDVAVFTDNRLIVRDAPALAPKKVETYVLPYRSIQMWSSEKNNTLLDLGSDVELWTQFGRMKITLKKEIDLQRFEGMLSRLIP